VRGSPPGDYPGGPRTGPPKNFFDRARGRAGIENGAGTDYYPAALSCPNVSARVEHPATTPRRARRGVVAGSLDPGARRARRTGPGRRRPVDRRPRRRAAARPAPGDLAAVRSVPPKARRARSRGAHRVLGRARPLPAGARQDRLVAVLADPGRGGPAAARRAGRARHRPGARRPAPAVGPSRLRLGQGRRGRGDRPRGGRPDLLDAPRAPKPRRGRQEARHLLQGVPPPACEGRGDLGRVHRIRLVLPVRFC